ncbi:MAG: proline racemase family protein [Bosea sp. (in: a-proteobacteria)]
MARLTYDDLHTGGEPVRIVTGGYPTLRGTTILDKRREALDHHDHLRRAMMWEPRGHAGMYGVIPVASSRPGASFGVLFTHHAGYSTMCGHATLALAKWAVETARVPLLEPETCFAFEAPCGLIHVRAKVAGAVVTSASFESVPSFVLRDGVEVMVPGFGSVTCDIAYGGAFYAIAPASAFGLDYGATPLPSLVDAAAALTDAIRSSMIISHPFEPDLGFLYGTILTDGAAPPVESANLCIFAERQIDRSPTGSGVTARMALDHANGLVAIGETRRFRSITGGIFTGSVATRTSLGPHDAVTVTVGGQAHWMGRGEFIIEDDDRLGHGFELPKRLG